MDGTIKKTKAKVVRVVDIHDEAADVLACLYAYADQQRFDLLCALDQKMDLNRSRPQAYYDKKSRKKKQLGIA